MPSGSLPLIAQVIGHGVYIYKENLIYTKKYIRKGWFSILLLYITQGICVVFYELLKNTKHK